MKKKYLASGRIECLHKMGKKPKLYSGVTGAMNEEAVQQYVRN